MPEILLHIGTHKTGTSSIQKLMSGLSPRLLQLGILYPQSGRPAGNDIVSMGHHLLAWSLTGKNNTSDQSCWTRLDEELARIRPVRAVVSSEALDGLDEPQIRRLATKLEQHAVRVVLYLREPFAYLLSAYKQQMKSSRSRFTQSFRQFITDNIDRCDYASLVDRWAATFGRDSIRIRSYERTCQAGGLERDFLTVCGAQSMHSSIDAVSNGWSNRSPSDQVTMVLRLITLVEGTAPGNRLFAALCHRARRNVLCGRFAGRVLTSVLTPVLPRRLFSTEDVAFVRERSREFSQRLLPRLTDPADAEFLLIQ